MTTIDRPLRGSKPTSDYECPVTGYRGIQGYKRGCRCDGCRAEKRLRNKAGKKNRLDKHGALWRSTRIAKANQRLERMVRCSCILDVGRRRRRLEEVNREFERLVLGENRFPDCDYPFFAESTAYSRGCRCERCRGHVRNRYRQLSDEKRKEIRRQERERYQNDPEYRIWQVARVQIRLAVRRRGTKRIDSYERLLGCNKTQLAEYLQSHPSWNAEWTLDDHGTKWEIDHVKPIAAFQIRREPESQYEAFHHTNLQPLAPEDNRAKHCHYDGWVWEDGVRMWRVPTKET